MKPHSTILLCVAALMACTTEPAEVATDTAHGYLNQETRARPVAALAVPAIAQADRFAAKDYGAGEGLPDMTSSIVPTNMIIRTATASIEVDSLEVAVAQVKQLAARLGGYVGSSGIVTGKHQLRQAAIEVKVPAARFDEVSSGLAPIGKLESFNVEAQDVGEEYVDVNARMENARRLERRLIDLLATRTGKLKDVLDVEQSLARVREEIERYEGRIRYLQAHTAMSTLSVTVHEPLPVVGTAGQSVMGAAVKQAWRNFVALASLVVQSLGVVLPLGVVAIVGWVVTRRWRLARQRAA